MKKFIIVYEDNTILKNNELTQEHYDAVADGIIDVIDIDEMKILNSDGNWYDIMDEQ